MSNNHHMTREEWQDLVVLASIPLRRLNLANLPVATASACIVAYRGIRFLLTAAHATQDQGNWAIETRVTDRLSTELYLIGPMTFIRRGSLHGSIEPVDLAFAIVPEHVRPLMQRVLENGTIECEIPRVILATDLAVEPDTVRRYGFSGINRFQERGIDLLGQLTLEMDMRFVGTENGVHAFELAHEHPGHDAYRGCSGAPIIDDLGEPVAIVVHGCIQRRTIFGTPVARYRVALDAELASLGRGMGSG
ncbi:MAG: hypothetical protein FJ291_08965 [Planctomycetes bacterium]|nr:hypothetical protein [Planctomycetota bacterium]